jgi:hypothetical protein
MVPKASKHAIEHADPCTAEMSMELYYKIIELVV